MTNEQSGVALLDFSHRVFIAMEATLADLRSLVADAIEYSDETSLNSLTEATRRVHDTFYLIECFGAELLTAELLSLLKAIKSGQTDTDIDTNQVLIQAVEKLTEYVDYLKAGGPDLPLVLLTLVNNMRACYGASMLSEALIVTPQFQIPDSVDINPTGRENFTVWLATVSSTYPQIESGLALWREKRDSTNACMLADLYTRISEASPVPELKDLCQGVSCIALSLADGGLVDSPAIRIMLGQAEQYLHMLSKQTPEGELKPEPGGQETVGSGVAYPTALFKNILYYLTLSGSKKPQVSALKKQYRLRELLPPKSGIEIARSALEGPGARLAEAICDGLIKELSGVKTMVDTIARPVPQDNPVPEQNPASQHNEVLEDAGVRLKQVSNTLLLLGLNQVRKLNDRAIRKLSMCAPAERVDNLMPVASDILLVEGSLEDYRHDRGLGGRGRSVLFAEDFEGMSADSPRLSNHQYQLIVDQCLDEAVISVRSVQLAYLIGLSGPVPRHAYIESAETLENVVNALQVLPLPEIQPLLGGAVSYLQLVAQREADASPLEQSLFADLMVSCEFYLNSNVQQQPAAADLLVQAERALDDLRLVIYENDATMVLDITSVSQDTAAPTIQISATDNLADVARCQPLDQARDRPDDRPVDAEVSLPSSIFIDEALEVMSAINSALVGWRDNRDEDALIKVRRHYHTLTGSARMAGAIALADFAAANEELTGSLVKHGIPPGDSVPNLLEESAGMLPQLINQLVIAIDGSSIEAGGPDILAGAEAVEGVRALVKRLRTTTVSNVELPVADRAPGESDLHELFMDEATEILDKINEVLTAAEPSGLRSSHLSALRADLHSLKGSAHVAGFIEIADLTHALEGAIERWMQELPMARSRSQLLQNAVDAISMNLDQAKTGAARDQLNGLLEQLDTDATLQTEVTCEVPNEITQVIPTPYTRPDHVTDVQQLHAPAPQLPDESVAPRSVPHLSDQIRLDAAAVERLTELSTEVSVQHARVNEYFQELRDTLLDLDKTTQQLRTKLRDIERNSELKISQADDLTRLQVGAAGPAHENDATTRFDPLELERFTRVSDDSRQLTEILSDFDVIRSSLYTRLRESEESMSLTARLGADIQESLLRSRLMRFSQHMHRLNSVVRQTAAALNRQVDCELVGGDRSIDRGIHKVIAVPLEHLLRNAVAHGIESPERRIAIGKPETGKIVITVALDGNFLVVTVSDDGAGVDMDAVQQAMNTTTNVAPNTTISAAGDVVLGESELLQMLFQSGFTTRSKPDQHAGRGLGLDAVERAVAELGGTVSMRSTASVGTVVTLRIPQRVSINQIVLVEIDGMTCGIPVDYIHSIQVVEDNPEVAFEDKVYTCANLAELLDMPVSRTGFGDHLSAQAVLVHTATKRYALRVNNVLGYREILSSPLGGQISSLRCYSGGSILADGRCALILDLDIPLPGESPRKKTETVYSANTGSLPQVLIVDDSVTMRTYTDKVLSSRGYACTFARDGIEALERLDETMPRLILLDLEMPRMNGFDLLVKLRTRAEFDQLPVVIISSRSSPKHREQADELGASGYLVKPYRDDELLRLVRRLTESTSH